MYRKLLNKVCAKLKLELHITQALKFGKDKNIQTNAIFGLLAAYYMKCAH